MLKRWLTVGLALSLMGCSSTDDGNGDINAVGVAFPTTDGQGNGDASTGSDTLQSGDSTGQTGDTGGQAEDSTVSPSDTGGSANDTSVTPEDTAAPPQDTTAPPQDTGMPPKDTGQPADAGASDDQLCAGADPYTGKGVPFKGLQYQVPNGKSYDFTCTSCPGGILGVDGKYRYYDLLKWDLFPNTPQAFTPSGAADIDTITFEGNWFTISRRDLNTGQVETASGYYFCPDPTELGFAKVDYFNVVLVYETFEGNGVMFNVTPGTAVPAHIGGSLEALELQGVPNWNSQMGGICPGPDCLHYCQVGSVIEGTPCTDPW